MLHIGFVCTMARVRSDTLLDLHIVLTEGSRRLPTLRRAASDVVAIFIRCNEWTVHDKIRPREERCSTELRHSVRKDFYPTESSARAIHSKRHGDGWVQVGSRNRACRGNGNCHCDDPDCCDLKESDKCITEDEGHDRSSSKAYNDPSSQELGQQLPRELSCPQVLKSRFLGVMRHVFQLRFGGWTLADNPSAARFCITAL